MLTVELRIYFNNIYSNTYCGFTENIVRWKVKGMRDYVLCNNLICVLLHAAGERGYEIVH
jgi:hypothetical protein